MFQEKLLCGSGYYRDCGDRPVFVLVLHCAVGFGGFVDRLEAVALEFLI